MLMEYNMTCTINNNNSKKVPCARFKDWFFIMSSVDLISCALCAAHF